MPVNQHAQLAPSREYTQHHDTVFAEPSTGHLLQTWSWSIQKVGGSSSQMAIPTAHSTHIPEPPRWVHAGTPGKSNTDGCAVRSFGPQADATRPHGQLHHGPADVRTDLSSGLERKRSRDDYTCHSGAAAATAIAAHVAKAAKTSSGGVPSRAFAATPPPTAPDGTRSRSPAAKAVSADETTADESPEGEAGTPPPRFTQYGMPDGPQVLGASAQALISREAWLNEAANYPQHTLVWPPHSVTCTSAAHGPQTVYASTASPGCVYMAMSVHDATHTEAVRSCSVA